MDVLAIVLRVTLSLAVVFGILFLAHKMASQRSGAGRRSGADTITVVARQGLTAKSAAVLIDAAGKRYLLGVAEGQVTLLDTVDVVSFDDALAQAGAQSEAGHGPLWVPTPRPVSLRTGATPPPPPHPSTDGQQAAANDSLLSPHTWGRAAKQALTGRTPA